MEIEKIYAIDTLGKYPIAFVRYVGCSPAWRKFSDIPGIQEYLNTHDDYAVNVPNWKY